MAHASSRRLRAALVVAALLLAVGGALTPGTSSRYAASITNTADSASTKAGFACADVLKAPAADGVAALFVYPLTESSGTTAADISGKGRTGAYSGTFSSSTAAPTPPCPRDAGTTWHVFTASSSNYVYWASAQSVTAGFSVECWIKTSTTNQGVMGFTTGASAANVMLYITSAGKAAFALSASASQVATSSATVTDGAWHEVVATFDSSAGMRLYVDGALSGTNSSTTVPSGSAYWLFGYANASGLPGAASQFSSYYTGGMRYASVYSSALTATQVTTHYSAGVGS